MVEVSPWFPGGEQALYKHIADNLRYLDSALRYGIEGTVRLMFIIDEIGYINHIRVTRSVGYGIDSEAIRILHSMPCWEPGRTNGKPVKVNYQLPIRFTLPK